MQMNGSNIITPSNVDSLLQQKSVIVVGNSTEIVDHSFGPLIDSFDVVVRLNAGTPIGREQALGTKTTIWSTGRLRLSHRKRFPADTYVLYHEGGKSRPKGDEIKFEHQLMYTYDEKLPTKILQGEC